MATIVLDAKEYARWHKRLAKDFKPAAMRGLMAGAMRAQAYAVQQTRKAPPANPQGKGRGGAVNTGEFIRAWRVLRTSYGALLLNDRPYAGVVEYGRKRGARQPPREPIVRWIQRRLRKSEKKARAMAVIVAKNIARRGLIGRHIITNPSARREILRLVQTETVRSLRRAIRENK